MRRRCRQTYTGIPKIKSISPYNTAVAPQPYTVNAANTNALISMTPIEPGPDGARIRPQASAQNAYGMTAAIVRHETDDRPGRTPAIPGNAQTEIQ